MTTQILIAGFGGQGVLFAGKFIAYNGLVEGRQLSWLPSYGPEMRGGTANCSVIVNDDPVASPLVDMADVVVAMNRPSLDKFESKVKPGGVLVINSSIIDRKAERDDIQVVYCDANRIAEEPLCSISFDGNDGSLYEGTFSEKVSGVHNLYFVFNAGDGLELGTWKIQ